MQAVLLFLKHFSKRGGIAVFFSGTSAKIISLLVAVLIARWLEPEIYGNVSYAILVVSAIIPFSGAGFDTALLRYGAVTTSEEEMRALSKYALSRGMVFSFVIFAIVAALAKPICSSMPDSVPYLYLVMFLLFGDFLHRFAGAHLRIYKKNRVFALLSFCRAGALIVMVIALVPFFGGMGYAIALTVAPLLAFILFIKHMRGIGNARTDCISTPRSELWRFAVFVGLGAILSRLQFFMDGILIGNIIEAPEALAQYRVASLLPVNLMILPMMFFKSEYVHITENHGNREFVLDYLKRYGFLSAGISLVLIAVTQLFGGWIIISIFGHNYADSAPLFQVLVLGIAGAFLLRQPFGNLLNASGRADLNVVNTVISSLITFSLLVYLIPIYGLMGAAAGTAIAMWASGLFGAIMYFSLVFPKLK